MWSMSMDHLQIAAKAFARLQYILVLSWKLFSVRFLSFITLIPMETPWRLSKNLQTTYHILHTTIISDCLQFKFNSIPMEEISYSNLFIVVYKMILKGLMDSYSITSQRLHHETKTYTSALEIVWRCW